MKTIPLQLSDVVIWQVSWGTVPELLLIAFFSTSNEFTTQTSSQVLLKQVPTSFKLQSKRIWARGTPPSNQMVVSTGNIFIFWAGVLRHVRQPEHRQVSIWDYHPTWGLTHCTDLLSEYRPETEQNKRKGHIQRWNTWIQDLILPLNHFIGRWVDKRAMIHLHDGMPLSH